MVVPRRLDRSAKRGAERPSLHDKRLIVERRSLRSALRASVETTESPYAIALPVRRGRRMRALPVAPAVAPGIAEQRREKAADQAAVAPIVPAAVVPAVTPVVP